MGFPGGSVVKNAPANAGDMGSIPGLGRSPEEGMLSSLVSFLRVTCSFFCFSQALPSPSTTGLPYGQCFPSALDGNVEGKTFF